MILRVRHLDRREGANPDMKGHEGALHTTLGEPGEKPLGQVERGRGCGHGSVPAGEDGLVIENIARIAAARPANVGRQRHGTPGPDRVDQSRTCEPEGEPHPALLVLGLDLGRKIGREVNLIARPQTPAGPSQRPPGGSVDPLDQRDLDHSLAATAEETGRQHARVVEDHEIARPEALRQVAHGPFAKGPVVDQQQARGVARAGRRLRDQFGRQVEVEELDAHGCPGSRGRGRDRCSDVGGQAPARRDTQPEGEFFLERSRSTSRDGCAARRPATSERCHA